MAASGAGCEARLQAVRRLLGMGEQARSPPIPAAPRRDLAITLAITLGLTSP